MMSYCLLYRVKSSSGRLARLSASQSGYCRIGNKGTDDTRKENRNKPVLLIKTGSLHTLIRHQSFQYSHKVSIFVCMYVPQEDTKPTLSVMSFMGEYSTSLDNTFSSIACIRGNNAPRPPSPPAASPPPKPIDSNILVRSSAPGGFWKEAMVRSTKGKGSCQCRVKHITLKSVIWQNGFPRTLILLSLCSFHFTLSFFLSHT